jgi:hypothetical protein
MKRLVLLAVAVAAIVVPAAAAADGAVVVPQRFCQVQFVDGGPLYSGIGVTVATPSGYSMIVCRVSIPPPPETVVMTFPDTNGDVVIVTRSGVAIVVFRQCGPSEPSNTFCG